ncbi:hypothetical protein [Amycolatopsis sp. NPDC051102]|uniref:hypothetical protein n=1 Tax=Amycolatopsis sp. NPDC051102 TaxID=3155163 RepID=UPI0034301779
MDVRLLTDQLTSSSSLPGVAFVVAREVIESAVLDGMVDQDAADDLMRAADHLQVAAAGNAMLSGYPALIGHLVHIAETRSLPDDRILIEVRSALRELVRTVPREGSVSPTADYVGF